MRRLLRSVLSTAAVSALALGATLAATPTSAQAATRCWGSTSSGRCVEVKKLKKHTVVVEVVPVENRTKHKKVHANCGFEKSVTKSLSASVGLTVGGKAELFKVAEVSTSVNISMSLSISASRSTKIAGDFTLNPGETVICERTYGYLQGTVVETTWSGTKSWKRTYTTKIPYAMGARFIDG